MKYVNIKKHILTIMTLLLVLSILSGCRMPWDKKEEPAPPVEDNTDTPEEPTNSGVEIVENEGDIEITIPDDMDSDGF